MESLGLTSDSFFGLLAFFIANVLINLYLLNKIFSEKRKNRLQRSQQKPNEELIKSFFTHQENRSKNAISIEKTPTNRQAQSLRVAYCKIERGALEKELNSKDYDVHIQEGLIKILKSLTSGTNQSGKNYLRSQLDALEKRIEKLPFAKDKKNLQEKTIKTLQHYKESLEQTSYPPKEINKRLKKVNQLVSLFESPEKRSQYLRTKSKRKYIQKSLAPINKLSKIRRESEAHIEKFEKLVPNNGSRHELLEQVEHFKKENRNLQRHIRELQNNMRTLDTHLPEDLSDSKNVASNKSHIGDLEGYSDEIIEANEKEIDRLRDVISNQRHSILEMESSIESLEKANIDNDAEKDEHIKKLRRCIQESETCITMLESEVEQLKTSLEEIKNNHPDQLGEIDSHQLNEELQQAHDDLKETDSRLKQLQSTIEFVTELLSASSIEDISLLIYENITNLSYTPNIILKSVSRNLIISDTGDLSVRDKATINNMRINEVNINGAGQLNFRLNNLAGVIRPTDLHLGGDEETAQHAMQLLKLANQCIELNLKSQVNQNLEGLGDFAIHSLKDLTYKLDQLLDDQTSRTQRLVMDNVSQIGDVARAKGVNAAVVARVNQIQQELSKQLANEATVKIKVRRALLTLLEELEEQRR